MKSRTWAARLSETSPDGWSLRRVIVGRSTAHCHCSREENPGRKDRGVHLIIVSASLHSQRLLDHRVGESAFRLGADDRVGAAAHQRLDGAVVGRLVEIAGALRV